MLLKIFMNFEDYCNPFGAYFISDLKLTSNENEAMKAMILKSHLSFR